VHDGSINNTYEDIGPLYLFVACQRFQLHMRQTQQHSLVTAAKEADASFHKTISGEFDAYALGNAL